ERQGDQRHSFVRLAAGHRSAGDGDRSRERSGSRGSAQNGAGRRLAHHVAPFSFSLRRRSYSGRALVTYGTESKLCGGGGDVVYHSSVFASHGSLPARRPLSPLTIAVR